MILTLLLAGAVLTAGQTTVGRFGANLPKPATGGGGGNGLIQSTNVSYTGSYKLPVCSGSICTNGPNGFSYFGSGGMGGGALTYYAAGNGGAGSLFISGSQIDFATVAEIYLPALVQGNNLAGGSTNISALNTATVHQNFADVTGGLAASDTYWGGYAQFRLGGLQVSGSKLYGSVFLFYDASHTTRVSYFSHGLTLATADFFGWETVQASRVVSEEDAGTGVGMIAGPITDIPSAQQSALGGVIGSGLWNPSIITRSSYGPSFFAFDPATGFADTPSTNGGVASSSPLAAQALLYYSNHHKTLGDWGNASNGTYYSWNDTPGCTIIEDNTLLVIEVYGRGHATSAATGLDTSTHYYGDETTNWNLNGTEQPPGSGFFDAYDPVASGHGPHSFPYQLRMIGWNLDDIKAVKAGTKQPWEPLPYAQWEFVLPFDAELTTTSPAGVRCGYDRVGRNIHLIQVDSGDHPGVYWPLGNVLHLSSAF